MKINRLFVCLFFALFAANIFINNIIVANVCASTDILTTYNKQYGEIYIIKFTNFMGNEMVKIFREDSNSNTSSPIITVDNSFYEPNIDSALYGDVFYSGICTEDYKRVNSCYTQDTVEYLNNKSFTINSKHGFIIILAIKPEYYNTNHVITVDGIDVVLQNNNNFLHNLLYRKSIQHEVSSGCNNYQYVTNLTAHTDGNIHIDIICNKVSNSAISEMYSPGVISFNDSMIFGVSTGKSYFTGYDNFSSYTEMYINDTNICYTLFTKGPNTGKTVMTFDLYVKPEYLNTPQTINVFGEDIVIPFGTDIVENKDEQIAKLMKEIETLKATPLEYDYNRDGLLTLSDIIYLARYLAEDDTLPVK